MISEGHRLLLEEALRVFEKNYPNEFLKLTNFEELRYGVVAPDFGPKNLGSHYALFRDGKYYNRIKRKPDNAYRSLEMEYQMAISTKSMDHLGRALHFVIDMLTIPHSTGLTDATFLHSMTRPHRKYEAYTALNMTKYYDELPVDIDFFTKNTIFDIMVKQTDKTFSYRNKVKNKKYYDEINTEMIPLIVLYVVGFLYRYCDEIERS